MKIKELNCNSFQVQKGIEYVGIIPTERLNREADGLANCICIYFFPIFKCQAIYLNISKEKKLSFRSPNI